MTFKSVTNDEFNPLDQHPSRSCPSIFFDFPYSFSFSSSEIGFFEQTAAENGLFLDFSPHSNDSDEGLLGLLAPDTQAYINYMVSVGSTASFEEGLVLLWAMEKVRKGTNERSRT